MAKMGYAILFLAVISTVVVSFAVYFMVNQIGWRRGWEDRDKVGAIKTVPAPVVEPMPVAPLSDAAMQNIKILPPSETMTITLAPAFDGDTTRTYIIPVKDWPTFAKGTWPK